MYLTICDASCPRNARWVHVLEAQERSKIECKLQIFPPTTFCMSTSCVTCSQTDQKCAPRAPEVHTQSSYTSKLVRMEVLLYKKKTTLESAAFLMILSLSRTGTQLTNSCTDNLYRYTPWVPEYSVLSISKNTLCYTKLFLRGPVTWPQIF